MTLASTLSSVWNTTIAAVLFSSNCLCFAEIVLSFWEGFGCSGCNFFWPWVKNSRLLVVELLRQPHNVCKDV